MNRHRAQSLQSWVRAPAAHIHHHTVAQPARRDESSGPTSPPPPSLLRCSDDGSRKSLRALRNCTLAFWCSFPLVWAVVQLGIVDLHTEEVMWSVSDFLGKVRERGAVGVCVCDVGNVCCERVWSVGSGSTKNGC